MALEIRSTLRVFSEKHTLSELNVHLGNPSKGFSIGDKFSKGKKTRDITFWSFDSRNVDSRASLEEHLIEVLEFIESKDDAFKQLKKEYCNIDITCMLDSDNGQGGAKLSALSMSRLSNLGLNLTFDVYADCE